MVSVENVARLRAGNARDSIRGQEFHPLGDAWVVLVTSVLVPTHGVMRIALLVEAVEQPLDEALRGRGHEVVRLDGGSSDALAKELAHTDLVVLDVERAGLIKHIASSAPGVEIIVVGPKERIGSLNPDVIAHIDRPIDTEELLGYVDEIADITVRERRRAPTDLVGFDTLFAGDSPAVANLMRRVRLVARSESPVWIFGDDGSGRAVVARAIHDRSTRRSGAFVAFNTAAYSDDELTKLLFHGETAAIRTPGGTLFLEQISVAGPNTQRELVQFLERKQVDEGDRSSARLIVGMQASDPSTVTQKMFSAELYYQLKVLEVEIPRLKDRARDLEYIVTRMLQRLAPDEHVAPQVMPETLRLLERYSFPGNLLELAHALTHAYVVAHGGAIEPQHLPPSMRQPIEATRGNDGELQSLDTVAKRFEREYLLRVLRSVGGNRGRAAEILGLSRKGLWGKLKAHGISDEHIDGDDDDDAEPAVVLQGPWNPRT